MMGAVRKISSRWNSEITATKEEINHYHTVYITKPGATLIVAGGNPWPLALNDSPAFLTSRNELLWINQFALCTVSSNTCLLQFRYMKNREKSLQLSAATLFSESSDLIAFLTSLFM